MLTLGTIAASREPGHADHHLALGKVLATALLAGQLALIGLAKAQNQTPGATKQTEVALGSEFLQGFMQVWLGTGS